MTDGFLEVAEAATDLVLKAKPLHIGLELLLPHGLPPFGSFHFNEQHGTVSDDDKVGHPGKDARLLHICRLHHVSAATVAHGEAKVASVGQSKPVHASRLYTFLYVPWLAAWFVCSLVSCLKLVKFHILTFPCCHNRPPHGRTARGSSLP